jgi:hypothetical protein
MNVIGLGHAIYPLSSRSMRNPAIDQFLDRAVQVTAAGQVLPIVSTKGGFVLGKSSLFRQRR